MGIFNKDGNSVELSTTDLQYLAAATILSAPTGSLPTNKAIEVAITKATMLYEAMYINEDQP